MFLTVDAADPRPLYRQIADGIKALIARGELRPGMALPSVRQVASGLGVNLNTIAVAYRELQDEGFLAVRHGSGAVVAATRGSAPSAAGLRIPLRTALTQLILAGLSRKEILSLVREEIDQLQTKGDSR